MVTCGSIGDMDDFATNVAAADESSRANNHSSSESSRRSGAGGYDNFFGDHAVCPTCRGLGHISHEANQEMMALIPLSDKRLRPRRTVLYVAIAVALCLITGALLLFFLFPRTANISSSQPTLHPTNIYLNVSAKLLFMTVTNYFNITNNNYYDIDVTTLSVTMYYQQSIIATEVNDTTLTLPMRSTQLHYAAMNATFHDPDYLIVACRSLKGMLLLLPFRATATFQYFGRSEQNEVDTYQYVHCNPES